MTIKDLSIYKIIKECDKKYAKLIENAYEVAKTILDSVTVYFPDETDHKIEHSLRILENVEKLLLREEIKKLVEEKNINCNLIKDTIGLDVKDLYFLVLGALFHDIGMCPDKEIFKEIAKEALGKEVTLQDWKNGKLHEDEVKKIRNYIKKNHGKISAKMITKDYIEYINVKDCKKDNELAKMLKYKIELSICDKEYLAIICEGHKIKLDELRKFIEEEKGLKSAPIKFDEIIVLLKLADDLDITKRRTPDLFYDLYIKGETCKETEKVWRAHKYISELKREGHFIYIFGVFDDPKVYAQFIKYIGNVRRKFELVQLMKISEKVKSLLPITINIDGIIKKGFVAVDIRLNLAGNNIIELLSSHLYGEDWRASIRELLQNAIDACKYRALKEFEHGNYGYKPRIEIEFDGCVLTFKDNGKGMTSDEIERFLLNIGKCYYSELDQKTLNELNPISKFGIGILSCFMLTDVIEVKTKPMSEDKAYKVEISKSIDDPVIIWDDSKRDIGTEIKFKIKNDAKEKIIRDTLLNPGPEDIKVILLTLEEIKKDLKKESKEEIEDIISKLKETLEEIKKDLKKESKEEIEDIISKLDKEEIEDIISKLKETLEEIIIKILKKHQNKILPSIIKNFVHHILIDTRYKLKDKAITIEIHFNEDFWTPTINDRAKEIEEFYKMDEKPIIKFSYTCNDFKSYVIISPKVDDRNYIAYNGILLYNIKKIPIPIQNITNPTNFGINIILDISNINVIKNFKLARDYIELKENFTEDLIETLNKKFVESLLKQDVRIDSHQIEWKNFNDMKYKKLYDNIIFECVVKDRAKYLKMSDLIKLAKQDFDIVLCHYTSTLINRLKKIKDNRIIIIVVKDQRMLRKLNKVFKDINIDAYMVIDYLVEKNYAKYCSECLDKSTVIEKKLTNRKNCIINEIISKTSTIAIDIKLLKFNHRFTNKLFEVEVLETPVFSIFFNRNHNVISTLCSKFINSQTTQETKQELLECTKQTFEKLSKFIIEFALGQELGQEFKIKIVREKDVVDIMKPLAKKLNVKITEKDLPWD